MRSILLVLSFLIAIGGRACDAQTFVTVDPEPGAYAWWLRARFHPFETEVRGIPVQKIRKDWCKASEFRQELFPPDLQDDIKLENFAADGFFDGSKVKQTALVGAYETCDGVAGSFFLVLRWPRPGAPAIRFISSGPGDHQYGSVHIDAKEPSSIWVWDCMCCDSNTHYKWDGSKRTFVVVPDEF